MDQADAAASTSKESAPLMEQRLHFITLSTHDLDAVRAFYIKGLGWTPTLDVADEIVFFQLAPGLMLGFFREDKFAQDLGLPRPAPVSGVTLAHNVESRDAVIRLVEAMAACGGTVRKQPQPGDYGGIFHAQVEDPNGVLWEIAHNPGWTIGDDGRVSFP
ncbi:VOC family protein [Ruicaihuangia caeni]|uniref:VOC family protein n=1 Tax=Ruicaihuangia caeni TaxID=3042517 RepID=UPI003390504B